jgi:hypothetical protein
VRLEGLGQLKNLVTSSGIDVQKCMSLPRAHINLYALLRKQSCQIRRVKLLKCQMSLQIKRSFLSDKTKLKVSKYICEQVITSRPCGLLHKERHCF